MWCAHLSEHLVEPLQRSVEMDLDPARGAGDVLAVVLRTPALDEAHADGAHLGQLVHRLEAVVNTLGEQRGKLRVIEDFERAARRNFADGRGVKAMVVVAVAGLHKYGRIGQTFCIHLKVL